MPKNQSNENSSLQQCVSVFGEVNLQRHAPDPTGTLQAWDAADLYLLSTLAEQQLPVSQSSVLIVNDEFGALSTTLASVFDPTIEFRTINDSFVGRRAIELNMSANECKADVHLLARLPADGPPAGLVIMKIPKSHALLIDQLHQIRHLVDSNTQIFAAGLARHLSPNVRAAFNEIIGPTASSRAVKKARVLTTQYSGNLTPGNNPYPTYLEVNGLNKPLLQHSAVFSQKRVDWGSELLIKHMPPIEPNSKVIDLGCGSGVLGLKAIQRERSAQLTFIDESSAAMDSVKANIKSLFPAQEALLLNQDCLEPLPETPADLILCNPPFHTHHNLVSETAERMFRQSLHALNPGGHIFIVGNRHLNYSKRLQRIFGNQRLVAENPRFQVISARRR